MKPKSSYFCMHKYYWANDRTVWHRSLFLQYIYDLALSSSRPSWKVTDDPDCGRNAKDRGVGCNPINVAVRLSGQSLREKPSLPPDIISFELWTLDFHSALSITSSIQLFTQTKLSKHASFDGDAWYQVSRYIEGNLCNYIGKAWHAIFIDELSQM